MNVKDRDGELFPKDEDGKFIYSDVDYVDTYKAMEALVDKGLTKAIGLSNFNSKQIQQILDVCTFKPVVNQVSTPVLPFASLEFQRVFIKLVRDGTIQVECHPWLNQEKLLKFCKENDIHMTAYSPLGSPDRPWAKEGEPSLLLDPNIKAIGEKYGKSNAQVLIKYQVRSSLETWRLIYSCSHLVVYFIFLLILQDCTWTVGDPEVGDQGENGPESGRF